MPTRVVYVHGIGATHWSFGWAPWLQSELQAAGVETIFETMPDSVLARQKYWLPFLKDHLRLGAEDIIVGWSTGAVAAMRFAEKYPLKASVLISPSYTDLDDEDERISGYFDVPWDWEAIRKNQQSITLLTGEGDPYIPQVDFEFIAEQLKPEWTQVPGAGHFERQLEHPEALAAVMKAIQ